MPNPVFRSFRIGAYIVGTVTVMAPIYAFYQAPFGQKPKQRSGGIQLTYKNEVKIVESNGYKVMTCNGIPDHTVGQFPGTGNPNSIAPQSYIFRIKMNPTAAPEGNQASSVGPQLFGVAINGVVFDPGTAELWNHNPAYRYEALSGAYGNGNMLGADENFAHVQPNGAYHYHGMPIGLLKKLDFKNKMALIGYAADGFPIYGNYGYSNPNDASSPLKQIKSSYRLKTGFRPGGPGGAYDGSFASDYTYNREFGDLDDSNGRTGVTPEYPKGTYYYVVTEEYPFVPRKFKGTPDSSFLKQEGPGFGGPGQAATTTVIYGVAGMVPADYLVSYLSLSKDQKVRLELLSKVIDVLLKEDFDIAEFDRLELSDDQMKAVASGKTVKSVLNAVQRGALSANPRRTIRTGGQRLPGGGLPGGGAPPQP